MELCIRQCLPLLPWVLMLLCQCFTAATRHVTPTTTTTTSTANITDHNDSDDDHIEVRWHDAMSVRLRRDGLRELRIAFQGVLVLETSRLPYPSTHPHTQQVTRLVQVTDGRQMVQTVLHGEVVQDCRTSRDPQDVLDFIDQYLHSAPRHARLGNVLAAYQTSMDQASNRSSSSTHSVPATPRWRRRPRRWKNPLRRGVSRPLKTRQTLGRFARYLHVQRQLRQCHRFRAQVRRRLLVSEGGVHTNTSSPSSVPSSLDSAESGNHSRRRRSRGRRKRGRRDLMTGWFIFPGTKWCGAGDIAEHDKDLGYDEALDSCCRDHDLCPHIIPRVSWRYSLFNFNFHTLSHCRCDRRFRKCLKKSKSPAAHMVGKIYFNVMGSQCFKFTRTRTCKRRNWWGKCKKYGFTKVAYPKKQRPF